MDTKSNSREQRSAEPERRALVRVFAAGVGFAGIGYVICIVAGVVPEANRPDGAAMTALGFALLISIVLWKPKFLGQFRIVEAAGVKFELLEIKERQALQTEQLQQLALLLPLVLPPTERTHLKNLEGGYTQGYEGNTWLQSELRRLRSIGLITSIPGQPIGNLGDGATFDLAEYVTLTHLGHQWLKRIKDLEAIEMP